MFQTGNLEAEPRRNAEASRYPAVGAIVSKFRATEHRVLGAGVERYSMPFFYEARAEATIAPLPIDSPDRFVHFQYGDFLWKRMTSFIEFRGMEGDRLSANLRARPDPR